MKLNVKAFAISTAIIGGALIFLLTWWMIIVDGATESRTFIAKIFLGYSISPIGSLIGMAWAFVDGLIIGAVFAWIYNFIVAFSSNNSK
ncbi:MAG: bacteriophage holin [Bacteroidota bacterium]|nr:bacteriophage holin [Bacteroidota bacterium]